MIYLCDTTRLLGMAGLCRSSHVGDGAMGREAVDALPPHHRVLPGDTYSHGSHRRPLDLVQTDYLTPPAYGAHPARRRTALRTAFSLDIPCLASEPI